MATLRLCLLSLGLSACWTLDAWYSAKEQVCGDGVLQEGEICDDGNLDENDACTSVCSMPVCGDGVLSSALGELCDDGNIIAEDACTVGCKPAVCGDGVQRVLPLGDDGVEACDDGNILDGDACPSDCSRGRCGDAMVWAGFEDCDDANGNDADLCPSNCQFARCGDGFKGPGEGCDDGNNNDYDACADCRPSTCGDGEVWAGAEDCDDGDTDAADYCNNRCAAAVCGDGIRRADLSDGEPGFEACDDGNLSNEDFCTNDCNLPACGDGFVQPGESCDDSSANCLLCVSAFCGNGALDQGEACDDGNGRDTDSCGSDCRLAVCGDRIVQTGVEQCDDGNKDPKDSCLNDCRAASCGDAVVHTGVEACDDGNAVDDDRCANNCTLNFCGASLLAGEDADGDGYTRCQGDCADDNPRIFPAVPASDVVGVYFVDAAQQSTGSGSDRDPFATIEEALAPLRSNPSTDHVVICVADGRYEGQVTDLRNITDLSLLGESLAARSNQIIPLSASHRIKISGLTWGGVYASNSNGGGSFGYEISECRLQWSLVACAEDSNCDDSVYAGCFEGSCHSVNSETLGVMRFDRDVQINSNFIGYSQTTQNSGGCATLNGSAQPRNVVFQNNICVYSGGAYGIGLNWEHNAQLINNELRWTDDLPADPDNLWPSIHAGTQISANLYLGNLFATTAGGGLVANGVSEWVWANRGFGDGSLGGALVKDIGTNMYVGYNSGSGYPDQFDFSVRSPTRCENNYTSQPQQGDCYSAIAPFQAPVPSAEEMPNHPLDLDNDGDDDRGDTLCTIGAWGRANPLFGAVDLSFDDAALSWQHCDGDADEAHAQTAFQYQLGRNERFEQILFESAIVESSEGLASLESIVVEAGHLRVRIRNENEVWSAWSAGLVPWVRSQ